MSCIFRNEIVRIYETVDEEKNFAAVVENLSNVTVTVILTAYNELYEIQVTLEPDEWFGILRDEDGYQRIESIRRHGVLAYAETDNESLNAMAA